MRHPFRPPTGGGIPNRPADQQGPLPPSAWSRLSDEVLRQGIGKAWVRAARPDRAPDARRGATRVRVAQWSPVPRSAGDRQRPMADGRGEATCHPANMWSVRETAPPPIKPELLRLATEFRAAIQQSVCGVPDVLKARFKSFPKDMCDRASDLLGRYLKEEGVENVQYVCGSRLSNTRLSDERHVWLEAQGFIIDITADQFPDGPGPVVVTDDRSWHSRFQVFERRDATDLRQYCRAAQKQHDDVFREIVGRIPARSTRLSTTSQDCPPTAVRKLRRFRIGGRSDQSGGAGPRPSRHEPRP